MLIFVRSAVILTSVSEHILFLDDTFKKRQALNIIQQEFEKNYAEEVELKEDKK